MEEDPRAATIIEASDLLPRPRHRAGSSHLRGNREARGWAGGRL